MGVEERDHRRHERIARNEALFREVNERIQEVGERSVLETVDVVCECGDGECADVIALTRSEYEKIRADALLFAVVPGHAQEDVEDVVFESDRFHTVRKHEDVSHVARATDPRAG